jgi:hypothetical protein
LFTLAADNNSSYYLAFGPCQNWQSMALNFDAECESKSEFFDEKCIPFTNNECTLGPQIGLK